MATKEFDLQIISRRDAETAGLPHYFTGKPCPVGHISRYRVSNYRCLQCELDQNNESRRAKRQARKAANPPLVIEGIIGRAEATAAGLSHYFTGYPCKRGHLSPRWCENKTCVECDLLRHRGDPAHKARSRAYYRTNRETVLAQNKAYQVANAAAINAKRSEFRMANKDRINAKIAEWAKANPAKRRAKERAREGRERGAEGTHTWADIEALKVMQNGLCAAPGCKASLDDGFHVDHVIAISKGGSNWPANLQLLCPPHNQSKAAHDLDDWVAMHQTSG